MPTLPVVALSAAFGTLWTDLAHELSVDLVIARSSKEAPLIAGALPTLLVVPGSDEALHEVRALSSSGLTVFVIGAEEDHRLAISLIKAGAEDYFALPGDLESLRSALASHQDRLARAAGDELPAIGVAYDFSQIVGDSPALCATLERASRIIPHGAASILLTGETGTGKELLARAIHHNGPRARGAFVEINCAAIPANLLESELFGYERGAFTDARSPKPGLMEAAHGGTLFLDEIGHMPLGVQGKLLKALDEKQFRRLGSVRSIDVDLRIIAATHVDLENEVASRTFREDLYYRLAVIPLHLPPLRERGADIILLARHFLQKLSTQYGLPNPPLDDVIRSALVTHSWPGNVRELRNALERALLLGGGSLRSADLFMRSRTAAAPASGPIPFPAPLALIEKEAAEAMVRLHNGNKSAAATALEISRSRLYRLLDQPEDSPEPEPPATAE